MEKNQQSLMCDCCYGTGRIINKNLTAGHHICIECTGAGITWVDAKPIKKRTILSWIKSLFN